MFPKTNCYTDTNPITKIKKKKLVKTVDLDPPDEII